MDGGGPFGGKRPKQELWDSSQDLGALAGLPSVKRGGNKGRREEKQNRKASAQASQYAQVRPVRPGLSPSLPIRPGVPPPLMVLVLLAACSDHPFCALYQHL